jgi:hypothetical protein
VGYQDLIEAAWKSGDFSLGKLAQAAKKKIFGTPGREAVRKQMEEIIAREAGDALSCFNAHREGFMKLAPFVKFREEKFGAVLFETRSEKVYTLSPTGAAVVREVVAGVPASGLAARLQEKYEDPQGTMVKEAETFLAQLKEKGLVTE